jgi:CRP-like cAMP-binding protein
MKQAPVAKAKMKLGLPDVAAAMASIILVDGSAGFDASAGSAAYGPAGSGSTMLGWQRPGRHLGRIPLPPAPSDRSAQTQGRHGAERSLAGMTMTMTESPSPLQNRLLAALPEEIQTQLFPHLELVPMLLGEVLYESGDTMRHVYFPIDSIVSLLCMMENGASAEISVVGNEGLIGVALFMGGESTSSRAVVQSAGSAYRLTGQRAKEEFGRHGAMLHLMLRHIQCLITQMAQTAVCNRHHTIDQQLCRLLLLSLDRLPSNRLTMTQELIANMLGVRREGVTDAAGKLMRLGVIEYSRGRITVLDRPHLERLSCECYAVVKRETDRLLPCLPYAASR